uniref:Uncharacterized protein n=1 Tax=Arundo donax TaxID=35708 RepID=A0A0A9HTZ7_ARUDO
MMKLCCQLFIINTFSEVLIQL